MAHIAFAYKEHWNKRTQNKLSSTMTEQISLENRAISTPSNRRNKMYSLTMESLLVSYCKTL